jgi:hypothetical protein
MNTLSAEEIQEEEEYKAQFEEACALHAGIVRVNQSTFNNIFNSLKPFQRVDLDLPYGFCALDTPAGKLVVDFYGKPDPPILISIGVSMAFLSYTDGESKVYRTPRVAAGARARLWLEGLKPAPFCDNPATFNGIPIENGDVADDVVRLIPYEIGRVVKMCSGPDKIQEPMDFIIPQDELEGRA